VISTSPATRRPSARSTPRSGRSKGALERAEAVLAALGKRAVELETTIAQEHEAEVRAGLTSAQADVARLEAELLNARTAEVELNGQFEDAVRATSEAGAEFDPERAKAVSARRTQEKDVVRWFLENPSRIAAEAPRHLHVRIAQAIERVHGPEAAAAAFAPRETAPHFVRVA
jgi:hypothetical protein